MVIEEPKQSYDHHFALIPITSFWKIIYEILSGFLELTLVKKDSYLNTIMGEYIIFISLILIHEIKSGVIP